jgi:hypothetical protein
VSQRSPRIRARLKRRGRKRENRAWFGRRMKKLYGSGIYDELMLGGSDLLEKKER